MLRGVRRFRRDNPGRWRPIVLTVGQRDHLHDLKLVGCPEIDRGVRIAIALG